MSKLNYSKELQEKIVEAYTMEHKTLREIQNMFHISFDKAKELLTLNNVILPEQKLSKTISKEIEQQIINLYTNELIGCVKISKLVRVSHRKVEKVIHAAGIMNDVGKNRKYKCNSNYFEKIDTEHKAY